MGVGIENEASWCLLLCHLLHSSWERAILTHTRGKSIRSAVCTQQSMISVSSSSSSSRAQSAVQHISPVTATRDRLRRMSSQPASQPAIKQIVHSVASRDGDLMQPYPHHLVFSPAANPGSIRTPVQCEHPIQVTRQVFGELAFSYVPHL